MSEQSDTLGALAKSLAAAQRVMHGAKKDSDNPAFRSRYADLESIWTACREPLASNGLAVIQTTEPQGLEGVTVVTTLVHESGEWIRGRYFCPCTKKDAHGFGSATTYARRFALAAIVGICPSDDDGNGAALPPQQRGPIKAPPPTVQQQAAALPSQLAASVTMMDEAVALNQALSSARTMGELNSVWLHVVELRRNGLPAKSVESLQALKDKRKAELSASAAE